MRIANYKKTVYLLAGRGMDPRKMFEFFKGLFPNFNVLTIEPDIEWYPIPNGINDQENAVLGVKKAAQEVANLIKSSNVPLNKVGIIGFSAGAVVALESSFLFEELGFVISCSGAILEPKNLDLNEISKIKTPYHIIHGKEDKVFSFEERYLPVKKVLENNESFFYELEMDHTLSLKTLHEISIFINEKFTYDDWD